MDGTPTTEEMIRQCRAFMEALEEQSQSQQVAHLIDLLNREKANNYMLYRKTLYLQSKIAQLLAERKKKERPVSDAPALPLPPPFKR